MAREAASGPRATSGKVRVAGPTKVTERAPGTGPEPLVVIESGRGPDGPTIVAAPEWVLVRFLTRLGVDQDAS